MICSCSRMTLGPILSASPPPPLLSVVGLRFVISSGCCSSTVWLNSTSIWIPAGKLGYSRKRLNKEGTAKWELMHSMFYILTQNCNENPRLTCPLELAHERTERIIPVWIITLYNRWCAEKHVRLRNTSTATDRKGKKKVTWPFPRLFRSWRPVLWLTEVDTGVVVCCCGSTPGLFRCLSARLCCKERSSEKERHVNSFVRPFTDILINAAN